MGPEVRLSPDGPDLCVLERPRADLWPGHGSPLGGICLLALVCGSMRLWGCSRPALRALGRLPVGAATCLGAEARSVRATP